MYQPVIFVLLFILQISIIPTNAQEVNIPGDYVNTDIASQLILINKDLEVLNHNETQYKNVIVAGEQRFTLENSVLKFESGIAYPVTDQQNNPYVLYFTELPTIHIQTKNTILDEPRVYARMILCEPSGQFHQQDIGIEYRGGSTQFLSKKSMRIECWTDTLGTDKENRSLLGMRNDDDWNLDALYYEPLRIRSKVGFELWRQLDTLHYQNAEPEAINGIHQRYVELFVNGAYQGIYALGERVDRKQLKLKKQAGGEIRGELYKGASWGAPNLYSLPDFPSGDTYWQGFEYKYPSEIIDWSELYDFMEFVIERDQADFYADYRNYFVLDNAVNYFIYMNLMRAFDNTGKNIFLARYDRNEPYFYVPWDLNGTFGMTWDGNQEPYYTGILSNGLFDRLMEDNYPDGFLDKLESRWTTLRNTYVTVDNLMQSFRGPYEYLKKNGIYEREAMIWEDYEFTGATHLSKLEEWLGNRIRFLDDYFYDTELLTNFVQPTIDTRQVNVYPNPAQQEFYIELPDENYTIKKIFIQNTNGQVIRIIQPASDQEKFEVSNLVPGIYFLAFEFSNGFRVTERLIIEL